MGKMQICAERGQNGSLKGWSKTERCVRLFCSWVKDVLSKKETQIKYDEKIDISWSSEVTCEGSMGGKMASMETVET